MAEYPKSKQLARGERRYRRKVASAAQWQRIIEAKRGPCRVCEVLTTVRGEPTNIEYHHLIARAQGGDDVKDNIVPLCFVCHGRVTRNGDPERKLLAESLTDGEYAYVVGKLGEGALSRLFGV